MDHLKRHLMWMQVQEDILLTLVQWKYQLHQVEKTGLLKDGQKAIVQRLTTLQIVPTLIF